MIPGIDISHWQSDIDWTEVKRAGVKYAFIKVTEFPDKKTTLWVDEKSTYNIKGASDNGILWGAYHFFRTHIDPVIQAQAYCETVGQFTSLPPVLDLEAAGTKGERLNYKVRLFLDEIEKLTSRKPIIYTSGGFWRSYMMYEKRTHSDWARDYPLWMAQYTTLWPTPLYPWAGWDFWQYSDKGKLPGIKTLVDLNWFNGSEEELAAKFLVNSSAASSSTTTGTTADLSASTTSKRNQMPPNPYRQTPAAAVNPRRVAAAAAANRRPHTTVIASQRLAASNKNTRQTANVSNVIKQTLSGMFAGKQTPAAAEPIRRGATHGSANRQGGIHKEAHALPYDENGIKDPFYKGDYQEPVPQGFQKLNSHYKPDGSAGSQKQAAAHLQASADELQWLRSYVISKAVVGKA